MRIFLLLLLITINIVYAENENNQVEPSFVRFDCPDFINAEYNFDVSVIFKIDIATNETVNLTFGIPKDVYINTARISTWLGKKEIPITKSTSDNEKITLLMNAEEFSLDPNVPYQVILNCRVNEPTKLSKKDFEWESSRIEKSVSEHDNYNFELSEDQIQIYNPQKTAGSSLEFGKSSKIDFNIIRSEWKRLYTEFWINADLIEKNVFTIKKGENDTIAAFSNNQLGFITFPIDEQEVERKDIYLGEGNWNYIGVLITNQISGLETKIFVNSELAYFKIDEDNFNLDKLNISFANSAADKIFRIDRLKIWEYNNNLSIAQKNKNFLNYDADSSKIIYQSNFDNVGEFTADLDKEDFSIIKNNLKYSESKAPLFSKAPSLTVNVGSSYNSIVWYVQEFSVAKEFEIERSVSGGGYMKVYSTIADDDPMRIYYFTDELLSESEVTYYRVKQINRDDSEVYSAEVKIGNKEIQEFNLSQNYPNPFNPITSIYVDVVIPSEFEVKVYDLVGNTVANLYKGYLAEGMHTFVFDGSNLPSGIYFYEVLSPKSQSVKKMILAK